MTKAAIAVCAFLSLAISAFGSDDKSLQGNIESAWNSSRGLYVDISVRNNTDSAIYLDSTLTPNTYSMGTQRDSIQATGSGGGRFSMSSHGKKIDVDRKVEIAPRHSRTFSILINESSEVIRGNVELKIEFSCYNRSKREITRVKLKQSVPIR